MLSSDLGLDQDPLGEGPAPVVVVDNGAYLAIASADDLAEGENTPAPDLVAFAKALTTAGAKLFSAAWCPACTTQKELFEDGGDFLPFIEVTNPDRSLNQIGIAEGITQFPTWQFPDGSREVGFLSLETLSARAGVVIPTSVNPFVAPIGQQTVLGGSPLHVALNGYDPNGGPLTYTVTSSNPSLVQATVLSGNRSVEVDFSGWGSLVFELFEDRVPGATSRFITLVEEGFYDAANNTPAVRVHRSINNFMFQFGDPTGTGGGGSSLGTFDDDFHVDLQHNKAGMLAWAKSAADDSANSQVYVTDAPTRHLDFNHPVFGVLTEGDKIRDAINLSAVNASNQPLTPITIQSARVFQDQENRVLMLKAAENAAGEADITVTVRDGDGNQFVETFHVIVSPDPYDGGPFLNDIPPITTTMNVPATFQLSATDVEGNAVLFSGVQLGSVAYTFSVNETTGQVTVTPPTDFIGTMDLQVRVRPQGTSNTQDLYDTQVVTISVLPLAPLAVDLLAASDSGSSNSDNVTNAAEMGFRITNVQNGAIVRLHRGSLIIGQATAAGSEVTITTSSLAQLGDGTYNVYATQTVTGLVSGPSGTLAVTVDQTPPPPFTSTPPTVGKVGQVVSYDAVNSQEGVAGTTYSLVGAKGNATIDPASGLFTWTPVAADIGSNAFTIVLTD
ncbi:MAG: peptidylprolyl isomerase, partial [Planctomycetes bacterium]|nr:peptidylprolyl isomerase [Planctomycetota bacterium]